MGLFSVRGFDRGRDPLRFKTDTQLGTQSILIGYRCEVPDLKSQALVCPSGLVPFLELPVSSGATF